jgi:hypothetical protein
MHWTFSPPQGATLNLQHQPTIPGVGHTQGYDMRLTFDAARAQEMVEWLKAYVKICEASIAPPPPPQNMAERRIPRTSSGDMYLGGRIENNQLERLANASESETVAQHMQAANRRAQQPHEVVSLEHPPSFIAKELEEQSPATPRDIGLTPNLDTEPTEEKETEQQQ